MNEWIELIGKNVPSKKNSKIITKNKRIISSRLCREYEKFAGPLLQEQITTWEAMKEGKDYPLRIGFYYYRDSRRKWDICNINQVIADLMQDYLYIPDDDSKHYIPVYLGEEVVKKDKSGVKFKILD